jgi:hypothetical protein
MTNKLMKRKLSKSNRKVKSLHEQITSLDVDLKAYKGVDAAAASKPGDSSRSGSKYGPGDKYKSAS